MKIHSRFRNKLAKKTKDALAATMVQGASIAVDVFSKIAETKLHKMAGAYKEALIEAIVATPATLQIKLDGLGKDLEEGYPARDMKAKLLASPNAKTSKDGVRYIDIPFRHALSATATRFQGMPPEIKAQVQAAVKTERTEAANEDREETNPLRVTGDLPAENAKHQTSIYSDMIRTKSVGPSGKSTSKFETIRRVSSKSPSSAWWHPGFEGIKALREGKAELVAKLMAVFKREMASRGLRNK